MSTAATQSATRTSALTVVAMIAFAANSLLCRQALGASTIDAASFAAIRTVAGAPVPYQLRELLDVADCAKLHYSGDYLFTPATGCEVLLRRI